MTLTTAERSLLDEARTAVLATRAPDGRARLVPICFVIDADDLMWTPLDEKPKTIPDPRRLARVRDILARPDVDLLVQRWSEDWAELAWLRLAGEATLVEPGAAAGPLIAALRAKYPQYADHSLEQRPMIRITITGTTSWGRLER